MTVNATRNVNLLILMLLGHETPENNTLLVCWLQWQILSLDTFQNWALVPGWCSQGLGQTTQVRQESPHITPCHLRCVGLDGIPSPVQPTTAGAADERVPTSPASAVACERDIPAAWVQQRTGDLGCPRGSPNQASLDQLGTVLANMVTATRSANALSHQALDQTDLREA